MVPSSGNGTNGTSIIRSRGVELRSVLAEKSRSVVLQYYEATNTLEPAMGVVPLPEQQGSGEMEPVTLAEHPCRQG